MGGGVHQDKRNKREKEHIQRGKKRRKGLEAGRTEQNDRGGGVKQHIPPRIRNHANTAEHRVGKGGGRR